MPTIGHTLTREVNGEDGHEVEIPVTVTYTFHKACRGVRERGGLQLEPDEPAHCEIESVIRDDDGTEIDTTDAEDRQIEESISDYLSGAYDEPDPDRYRD